MPSPLVANQTMDFSEELTKNSMDSSSLTGDAFDGSSEPIIFMSDNRMPVMIEFSTTVIYIIFGACLLALLFILPGVRRTKLTSFLGLATLLSVGASILLALHGTNWLTAIIQINGSPYSSLTSETISGQLEIMIGLKSVNVTLKGFMSDQTHKTVDYNERFYWDTPEQMAKEHTEALRRGLPFPILSVTEFLSQDSEGFNWARQLRQAGFYSSMALYAALASWFLMAVFMCILPIYLPHMMQITGAIIITSIWLYTTLIQSLDSYTFKFGGHVVEFAFGHTTVIAFSIGALSMFAGIILFAIQVNQPQEPFTIMESERLDSDRKLFYHSNILSHSVDKKVASDLCQKEREISQTVHVGSEKPASVMIPMGDIEQNFQLQTAIKHY